MALNNPFVGRQATVTIGRKLTEAEEVMILIHQSELADAEERQAKSDSEAIMTISGGGGKVDGNYARVGGGKAYREAQAALDLITQCEEEKELAELKKKIAEVAIGITYMKLRKRIKTLEAKLHPNDLAGYPL
jgi:hypothetical protein